MINKIVDRIIAILIIVEIFYYLPFIPTAFYKTFFTYYTGLPLALIIIRIALLYAIAITAVILFLKNSTGAKWALTGYVGIALILRIWIIRPNSEQYMKLAKEAQNMVESGKAIVCNISACPSWWILALYVIGLIYVFTLRERYKKV
jgi:phosphoglycerol transferase MdoB-like AlkP superfamily enzyme